MSRRNPNGNAHPNANDAIFNTVQYLHDIHESPAYELAVSQFKSHKESKLGDGASSQKKVIQKYNPLLKKYSDNGQDLLQQIYVHQFVLEADKEVAEKYNDSMNNKDRTPFVQKNIEQVAASISKVPNDVLEKKFLTASFRRARKRELTRNQNPDRPQTRKYHLTKSYQELASESTIFSMGHFAHLARLDGRARQQEITAKKANNSSVPM